MNAILSKLSGYKTYALTLIAAIYGYGVAHNLWQHSPSLDVFLGAGGVAAFRSAMKAEAAKIAQALITDPIKLPSAQPPAAPSTAAKAVPLAILAFALLSAMTFSPGCATKIDQAGPYGSSGQFGTNDNTFLLLSDKTLVDSKDTMTVFLRWELKNRQTLATLGLGNVTKVADTIRSDAPLWFTNAFNARQVYVAIWRSNPAASAAASNNFQASVSLISAQALASSSLTNSVKGP